MESCAWTQRQQKILEKAMQVYPRGVDDRWDKIADSVPGKTKVSTVKTCYGGSDVMRFLSVESTP